MSDSTYFEILDFSSSVDYSSSSSIFLADSQSDLSGIREFYTKTNLNTLNLDSRIGTLTSNILCKIPVAVDMNNTINYMNYSGFRPVLKDKIIKKIEIALEDDKGNQLNLDHHFSYSIEIQLYPLNF